MAAGNAVIGALRVSLGLDSAQFEQGLKQAQTGLGGFAKKMAGVGAVVAAAAATAASGMAVAVNKVLKDADELAKLSQKIGIPVDELSRLKHAADLSGTSLDTLAKGAGRLARNMQDASDGLKTPQRAFDQLGINIKNTDGSMKSMSEILPDIADRFAKMRDGTQKTALAMVLLGRSGQDMIPLLNGGSEALRAMMQEADDLGLVISTKTAKAAEQFNDNMTRLGAMLQGVFIKITANLAPALASFSGKLVEAAKNGDFVGRVSTAIANAMNFVAGAIGFVARHMDVLIQAFKVYVAAQIISYTAAVAGAFISLAKTIRTAGLTLAASSNLTAGGALKALVLIAGGIAIATGQFEKLEAAMGALWERVKTLVPEGIVENFSNLFGGIEADEARAADSLRVFMDTWQSAKGSFGDVGKTFKNLQSQAQSIFDATRTPAERMAIEMDRLNLLLQKGLINWDTFGRAVAQVREQFDPMVAAMQEVGQTVQSAFMNAFDAAIDGAFNLQDAIRGLIKDFARLAINSAFQSLFGAVTGALFPAVGAPMNILPGFATGGSFSVGGSGGIDSQMVAFRATPGEMVDIHKPGQDMGGSGFTYAPQIDARGADAAAVSRIEQVLAADRANFEQRVVNAVNGYSKRRMVAR
jgi:hypothetical protein